MRTEGAVEGAALSATARPTFLEFFCGGGMARVGLGDGWRCLFANDLDSRKAQAYISNFGRERLAVKNVTDVAPRDIPTRADLAWASFPCQDLSLAGAGAGLDGERSGAFWPFWRLIRRLSEARRGPRLIALENVCGLLSSRNGADFSALVGAVQAAGYRCGALVVDAVEFTPQSRPRLFLLAVARDIRIPDALLDAKPPTWGVSPALLTAHARLDPAVAARFLWWRLPPPPRRNFNLVDLVEDEPKGVEWQNADGVARLLSLMAPLHRARVGQAAAEGGRRVGALYRRTRPAPSGGKTQRAEVRFDGVAGCLRTPAGGSSRQSILVIERGEVRARLLSAREAARLMGLPDSYALPESYNEAYHLLGDGVVAPIVRHLAAHWMEPILKP
jgi:DNA (cytosine-5)-methyltransferase 1